ncbi:ABC transporter ATP-binding protein [Paraburkholderia caledonica]|mgnify:CR=1 FL=1|jgi:putative spermidine/putrescine transport system ATP-binding protein|uniref:ABC transporter ATP-binding protein n=1 Tax=Paraburkholderia TaxID=1822464 RepID=UPI0004827193|nr:MULTISPECIES: ABC transporter ATP-binding protein [Paraburkholderia]OWJ61086.1 ABC transporter ATP-binding protein [Burkholderia sp. Bk]AXF17629.1 ABC transporter ATP-binding protein [Paraburkholderia caledonica]MDR7004014.1 putative spermidine/putrescine transport system ATP-binding protein [Paraburkholderia strydomiana]TCG00369.1 spermidine/putrescine ABC transporter ATP-binding protein [Paraburkholderia strydomiana]CAH2900592.1 MAG: ABC transporter, ATP-binding protein (cluster 1, maltos
MKHHFEQLRLDSVSRSFTNAEGQSIAALQGLDLNIRRGEFIALLGPSGCGKSTALNCIAGLQPLSGGGIWLDDKRIDVLPPEKRGFGMVFQNYALFPHMSVLDNVGFGLKMRGVGKSEIMRRAREALQLVQLVGHERKLPGQLSGGQQQRVAIARAIVIEPPLILMDEPLSNLDTKLRIEMRAEIRRIHSQLERATLYVTHDQDEALSMADRIVVMREGVVQQVATPKEVYTRPQNLHVARFMGYRNVAEFTLEGMQGEGVAVSANGVRLIGTPMAGFNGKRVSVALRPEDMERTAPGTENAFDALVTVVEYGGNSSLLRVKTAFGDLWARVAGEFVEGQHISLRVPPSRTLVYDGEAA